VDDLIDGFVAMMEADDAITGPINLGNPQEIPVLTLAERIVELVRSSSGIVRRPLPQDDPVQRCPDITLAQRLLNWSPRVSLDDGLRRTIAYFQDELTEKTGAQGERAKRIYEAALGPSGNYIVAPPGTDRPHGPDMLLNLGLDAGRATMPLKNGNGAGKIGA
jgi:UDP-glucuronate decarboxylase